MAKGLIVVAGAAVVIAGGAFAVKHYVHAEVEKKLEAIIIDME